MTNEEAKKKLGAKLVCLNNEMSGLNYDCNMNLCNNCSLNYEQGNIGDIIDALYLAIKALEVTEQVNTSHNGVQMFPKGVFKAIYEDNDDCISRKDALKAIEEAKQGWEGSERYAIDECHTRIAELPPITREESEG